MTDAARKLYELLSAGEIDEQTVHDTLEAIGAEEKLEAYVHVQKQLEAEYAAFDAEVTRMEKRMDSIRAQIDRLRRAEVEFLQATGEKKAKAGTFTITLRESQAVTVDDAAAIPADFLREIPAEIRPDKKAIRDALKAGQNVPGVHLESSWSATVR
jgi:predicted  nucleic acid-binding Zn-ribbon protein